MTNPDDRTKAALRQKAEDRVKRRRSIQTQVGVFVIVNIILWVIWAINDSGQSGVPWPVYVTVAWGVILAFITWRTLSGDDAAVDREMERMEKGDD
jgi:ABC-type xylose transport system permease subunit